MVSKSVKNIDVQMKSNIFYRTNQILILLFLKQFKDVCTNEIPEGITTWLLRYFMKRYVSVTLSARLILSRHGTVHQDGTLTSYSATINHLLDEYSSDDIIDETVDDIN